MPTIIKESFTRNNENKTDDESESWAVHIVGILTQCIFLYVLAAKLFGELWQ